MSGLSDDDTATAADDSAHSCVTNAGPAFQDVIRPHNTNRTMAFSMALYVHNECKQLTK